MTTPIVPCQLCGKNAVPILSAGNASGDLVGVDPFEDVEADDDSEDEEEEEEEEEEALDDEAH